MNYTVENGLLRVNCKNCDRIQIFDDKGILLDAAEFNHEGTYQYRGNGIYVVSYNGKSVKVNL